MLNYDDYIVRDPKTCGGEPVGHNVDSVQQEGLAGSCDDEVFAAAQEAKRFLITQDLDFSDIRKFTPGRSAHDYS